MTNYPGGKELTVEMLLPREISFVHGARGGARGRLHRHYPIMTYLLAPTCADPESFARGGRTLTTFFCVFFFS